MHYRPSRGRPALLAADTLRSLHVRLMLAVSWAHHPMLDIRTKRVYEPANSDDGFRVLVDRVWPRGMTKSQVQADLWLKDVAPSTALRRWFGHDRSKWEAFKSRYFSELDADSEAVRRLLDEAAKGRLTLIFSAKDAECNQAVALTEYLLSLSKRGAS